MLEDIQTVIEIICLIVATFVGVWGLNTWRREVVGRRKTELAEDVLAGIYQYRNIMDWVRSPFSFQGEGETREADETEDAQEKKYRNRYFVPIERLQQHSEFLGRFHALKYRFIAYFGREAEKPFSLMNEVRNLVSTSSHELMDTYKDRHPYDEETKALVKEWKTNIGWAAHKDDPLKSKIEEAIKVIEDTCKPYLSEGKK